MSYFGRIPLTRRILMAMAAGLLLGALVQLLAGGVPAPDSWANTWLVGGLFYVVGAVFIKSLTLLVVPLVLVSLVCGVSNLSDGVAMGRIAGKTVALYLITTALAVIMALSAALVIGPGEGVNYAPQGDYQRAPVPPLVDVIVNIFPNNPVAAMANGSMLQVIVFALLLGVAIASAGDAGGRIRGFFEDLNVVVMRLVMILIELAPFGVFFLMARLGATTGLAELQSLAAYMLTVVGVLFVHAGVTYPTILLLLARLSPLTFYRKMRNPVLVALSTASSNATLPVTLRAVRERLGVEREVASFSVPMGATINMDGTAIMQGVAVVFIAQFYAHDLTMVELLLVVLTATAASIGTAGVPGVGLIMLAMVLEQVQLPVEGIALIIGVDRLLDMLRTAVNVCGDGVVATIVARSEGRLDESVFNDPMAGDDDEIAAPQAGPEPP